jgi:hypothetical protein
MIGAYGALVKTFSQAITGRLNGRPAVASEPINNISARPVIVFAKDRFPPFSSQRQHPVARGSIETDQIIV